jgi:hypothetical protein
MTASTSSAYGTDKNVSPGGIHAAHAYSILSAVQYNGERLVKMRNPHGKSEWNGKWSDTDKSRWNNSALMALRHVLKNDGTFFIPYSNFRKEFKLC